jgi:hypothetical protein
MRKLSYLFAVAAIGGLTSLAPASSAGPIAGEMARANQAVPVAGEGLIQKVHGWHCRRRYGWYHGHKVWHRHRRACYDYNDYDYGYNPYYYGAPYPFFSFSFGDFDGHHHRRHHHHHHHMW